MQVLGTCFPTELYASCICFAQLIIVHMAYEYSLYPVNCSFALSITLFTVKLFLVNCFFPIMLPILLACREVFVLS